MNCRNSSTPSPRRTWGWLKNGLLGAALALTCGARAQISLPYTETFASIAAANGFPTVTGGAWARTGSTTLQPTYIANQSLYNRSGNGDTKFICFRYSPAGNVYTVGPFSLNGSTTYQVSVLYKADGLTGFGPLALTYGTGTTVALQSTTIASVPADITNTSFQTLSGTFTTGTTGSYYVGIKCTGTSNPWYITLDDFNMQVAPSCLPPGGLAASNVTYTSATLSWNAATPAPSNGYAWEVRTSGAGGSGGTGLTASGTTGAGVLSAATGSVLTANTSYNLYVSSDCGGSGVSTWAGPYAFYTGYCISTSTNTGYYINNFATTGGLTNITNASGGLSSGGYGDFTGQSASQYANTAVNFSAAFTGGTFGFGIWIDWNNNLSFADVGEQMYNSASYGSSWSGSFTVPSGQASGNYRMRVRADYNATSPAVCGNISSGETEDYTFTVAALLPCTTPNPGNTISTSAGVCSATNFTLSLQNVTTGTGVSYEWQSADDAAFTTNVATNLGTAATYTTTATATKWYRCNVTCSTGPSTVASNPVQVQYYTGAAYCGSYCVPTTTYGCTDGDVIARVQLNTLDNNSGTGCPSGTAGYSNYVFNGALTTTLQAGTSYGCTVYAGQYTESYAAWIDYNDDGTFDNTTERIGYTSTPVTGSGLVGVLGSSATFPISLACNPPVGPHRLRVRAMYSIAGSAVTPCTNNSYGEVEDYLVTVAPPPPCPTPSALATANVTNNSVDLSWTIGCTETAWEIEYGPTGFTVGTGTVVPAGTNPYTLSGLSQTTPYDVYVRANCGGNGTSSSFGPVAFTTLGPPACVSAPTSPTNGGSACTNASVTLSWPSVATATGYDVILDGVTVSSNQSGTTYAAGTLSAGTHTWSITPQNTYGSAAGCATWSFSMASAPAGDIQGTAIAVGSLPATISGDNLATNCWTSSYAGTNAQSSPDVWYTLTTGPCAGSLSIGLCGSFDSYLHLLDASGTELAFDDDDEPVGCATASASSLTYAAAANTTYYIVAEGYSTNTGTFTLTVGLTPTDTDGDGTCDSQDGCPNDPNKIATGICGCGVADTDTDSDGTADCNDGCPNDPNKIAAGVCGCGVADTDSDVDGVADCVDPCPFLANVVPGDPCNDGNVCTINDVFTALCVCAGTFQDTDLDGVCDANDPCPTVANVVPGDPCDDGNVCTINDAYTLACACAGTFQDTDSDGICDANDNCPNLAGVQGDACDDGNPNTTLDVITASCVCAGQAADCLGVPGGTDLPGTPCNDANVCTINDTWDNSCVCVGTFQDTDLDGICDANDNCPTLAGQQGDACNDGDACTTGDVITASCVCAGTPSGDTDGDGICDALDNCPNLAGQQGDACSDGDVCTINDVITASCVCAGTFQDTDGDGVCDANDNCPNVTGQQGSSCNDSDPCTINDVLNASCVCVGTPAPVTAGVVGSSPVYCTPGAGVTLTASGGATYSWAPSAGLNATTGNPVTATPASATTYTVTATNAVGCTGTATVTVNTGSTPATPVMSALPNPVCPGSNSQLGASIGGGAPTYCVPSLSTGCSFPDQISQVTVAGITRSSGCDNTSGSNGYSNFAAPTGALVAGSSGNAYSITTSGDVEGAALWIDFDQNGTFDNPSELIFNSFIGTNPATYTGTFTVPAGAINGNTRLRVRCTYNGAPGTNPCGGTQTTYGETEDYTVMITGGAANCAPGINFSWSPTTYLSNPLVCNPMANGVTSSTTYTVTATNAAGCSSTNTLALNVQTTDTDADGTVDCLDGCPNDANKIAPGQCGCGVADTDNDADGTANCNDGCPNDPNKLAPGICGCGVADTDTDADGTADCNDGCPTDPSKIAPGQCGCGVPDTDTDSDGIANCNDNCPNVAGVIGTPCNDNNVNTINDVLTASCVCAGTTPNCAFNTVLLDLVTDNNGGQTSWDVVNIGTTTVVCSGSGYLNNQTITLDCCLPNGCYELRVFDSAGDGMANGPIGGYVLRAAGAGNKRIIDNGGDGIFTTTSTIANNLGFCVPIGTDAPVASSCDKINWVPTDVLQATVNPAVTGQFGVSNANSGYQFWFFNPDGGYSRRVLQTHAAPGTVTGPPTNQRAAYLKLSSIVTQPIPYYTNLNIRIRTEVAGVFSEWGPACRFRMDPQCTTTQLTQTADPVISCGATGLALTSTIYATAVTGATNYQFEFSKAGYLRRITVATRSVALSFVTSPLQNNNCYQVRVRISYDGGTTYCPFGTSCNITVGTATCGSSMPEQPSTGGTEATEGRVSLWPNPNDGSFVNLAFTGFDANVNTVGVDVTDVYGKLVATRTIPVQDGYLKTTLAFEQDLAPGLYLVNLTAGEKRYTERLVIQ